MFDEIFDNDIDGGVDGPEDFIIFHFEDEKNIQILSELENVRKEEDEFLTLARQQLDDNGLF